MVVEQENRADESLTWKNEDNAPFYETIPPSEFRQFPIRGGFENGCDIDLIFPYIKDTGTLIEAGAGYGRVIDNLIKRNYVGKIYAIERSQNFYKHLIEKFGDKAEIINADIQGFVPKEKVDVVLWMWAGISDFPSRQHLKILSHMTSWLKPTGLFVLETISHTLVPMNATSTQKNGQFYQFDSAYGKNRGSLPSSDEVELLAAQLGYQLKRIPYKTETSRDRIIHILSR